MLIKPNVHKVASSILPAARKRIRNDKCPFCNDPVNENGFRDNKSKKEYSMSGLCQSCQDKIFDNEI